MRDNVIEQVGPTAELPAAADRVIDARGMVVLPGLVNTHHHLYQTLTRCLAQDDGLFGWLRTLYPIWARMNGEAVYVSAKVGLAELLLSGCTTSSDHLYLYPNGSRIDDEIRAAQEIGIRFHATRGSMSLGESKGGLPPDSVVEEEDAILRDCQRAIETFHQAERYGMVRVALAPCSPFSVTPDLMRESAAMARSYGVRLHTHLAETLDEEQFCLETFGQRPVAYVESLGWTGDDVWHAHCVHMSDAEIAPVCPHRHRRGPLPQQQHAPGQRHRAGGGLAAERRAGRPGRGRLSQQQFEPHAGRGATGDAAAARQRRCRRDERRSRRWSWPRWAARPCWAATTSARWPPAWRPTSSATGWSGWTSRAPCTTRWPRWSSARRSTWTCRWSTAVCGCRRGRSSTWICRR